MKGITLVSVNWNRQRVMELMLKSYVRHHHEGEPLNLLLIDNGSTDGSKEWLRENEIPFVDLPENIWHEPALNQNFHKIKTQYCLLVDTDVMFLENTFDYIYNMQGDCISVGELIDNNYFHQDKINDRISPWFWLFDIKKMREGGVHEWRDPSNTNWVDDVGSPYWAKMKALGYTNYNLKRKPGDQERGIGMEYSRFIHFGKLSWDLTKHEHRTGEIMNRLSIVEEKLKELEDVDLKNKFV